MAYSKAELKSSGDRASPYRNRVNIILLYNINNILNQLADLHPVNIP
jgi:hypothetical protein